MLMQDKKEKLKPEMKKSVSAVKSVYKGTVFAVKNSRGVPGNIRAGFVPTPVLQKKFGGGVVQLSHIKNVIPNTQAAPQLVQNAKPTIVFESMASNSASAQSIFDQTKQYSGNTICVFGLNRCYTASGGDLEPVQLGDVGIHFFRGFAFEWEKPGQVHEWEQYKMPFIEARAEVMGQAEKIVNTLPVNSIPPNPPQQAPATDNSKEVVYRWIDGDAQKDSSDKIPQNALENLANGTFEVLSGSYGWRTTDTQHTLEKYKEFLKEVSLAEHKVRFEFFKRKGKSRSHPNCRAQLPEFISSRGMLGDFYFPETGLMFYSDTHHKVLKAVRSKQAVSEVCALLNTDEKDEALRLKLHKALEKYVQEDLDTQLKEKIERLYTTDTSENRNALKKWINERYAEDKNEFDGDKGQDKESMKMLTYGKVSKSGVYFEPQLVVSKPLKGEFEQDGGYLGNEMLQLLKQGTVVQEADFFVKLKGMRQSAFGRFKIPGDSEFQTFIEARMREVYSFYNDNRAAIREELSGV